MAKLEVDLSFDATLLVKIYEDGFKAGFLFATDTSELDSALNKNNIDDAEGI